MTGYGDETHRYDVALSQEAQITMQTVGPGSYDEPPAIAGESVEFAGMRDPYQDLRRPTTTSIRMAGSSK